MSPRTSLGNTVCISLLAAAGFGCAGTPVHFDEVPAEKLDLTRGHPVKVSAGSLQLFDLIPIGVNDRQIRAYEALKKLAPNEFITDITVQDSYKWVFIGIKYNTTMTGLACPDRTKGPAADMSLSGKLEELKNLHDKGQVSDDEYQTVRQRILDGVK